MRGRGGALSEGGLINLARGAQHSTALAALAAAVTLLALGPAGPGISRLGLASDTKPRPAPLGAIVSLRFRRVAAVSIYLDAEQRIATATAAKRDGAVQWAPAAASSVAARVAAPGRRAARDARLDGWLAGGLVSLRDTAGGCFLCAPANRERP